MDTSRNEPTYIFYAETIEGISFKVLFDIIEKSFKQHSQTVNFKVNKNGIFIRMLNEKNKLIIESSFYGKFMNEFVFNDTYDFLFGITHANLSVFKKLKKTDILPLSVEKDSRKILIKISNSNYIKPIIGIQNYIIDIPDEYCDFPINLNNSASLLSSWKKIITEDDEVKIELMKNTIKMSFHDTNSLIIGKDDPQNILYNDVFNTELISNIIKISSFGTLRIYHNQEENLPLLFSAMVGCESGYINIYVSPSKYYNFQIMNYDTVY